jgi:D-amino-acid dehydrogenase
MSKVIVIGGGIIGLSSAYYLTESGHEVTVIDMSDLHDGCSYGNAGYVCPSHYVPMATPGIVKQGLKWMFNSRSPFYVQPRLSLPLIDWGLKFMKSANMKHVDNSAVPLRDIALLSQHLYEDWVKLPQFDFNYKHKGLLEIFQTEENAHHAHGSVEKAKQLGLDVSLLNYEELQNLETEKINALGAIFFQCDAQLDPGKLMQNLKDYLRQQGVLFKLDEEVTAFEKNGSSIRRVITKTASYEAEKVVIATGSWSRELAARLDLRLPLMPGRGYSVTLENSPYKLNYPAILVEGRVAITPISENKIRFGGTMEITSTKTPPNLKRVEGILNSVKSFYPAFNIPLPEEKQVWYGYRPCSADGLPYIGRLTSLKNCIISTGHSMLGLSLGAGTGKLVSELVNESPTSIDIKAFDPERYN